MVFFHKKISHISAVLGKKAIFAENENHYENESHKKTALFNVKILSYFDEVFSVKIGADFIKFLQANFKLTNDDSQNAIIIYNNGEKNIDVNFLFNDKIVWLSAKQIADLYGIDNNTVYFHVENIYKEGELNTPTVQQYWIVQNDENEKKIKFEKAIFSSVKEGNRIVN